MERVMISRIWAEKLKALEIVRALNYKLMKKESTIVNSDFSRWSWNTTQAINTLHCTHGTPDKRRENIQLKSRAVVRHLSRDKLKPTTFVN